MHQVKAQQFLHMNRKILLKTKLIAVCMAIDLDGIKM